MVNSPVEENILVDGRPIADMEMAVIKKKRTKSLASLEARVSPADPRWPSLPRQDSVGEGAPGAPSFSGWLSICEDEDLSKGCHPEKILWSFRYVSLFPETRKLTISAGPLDEDVFFDSFSKGNNQAEVKPSLSRSKLEAPGSYGLKQFISRRLAINRSKGSGSKLINPKSDMLSRPKSPNGLWLWKSQESEDAFDDEDATLRLVEPDQLEIRPIHQSVSMRPYCFQVQTASETKFIACSNEEEYNCWMQGLRDLLWPDRRDAVHLDTSLSVWLIEAKGVPHRKRYFCELMLDKVLYARTSVKNKQDMLFWGEQFTFSDLPPIETLTISLFRESDTKRKRKQDKNVFVGSSVVNLFSLEANAEIEKWIPVYVPGLSPKMNQKAASSPKSEHACIRMKLKYDAVVVLPMARYKDLHEYLKENYLHLTKTLESCVSLKTKDKLAQTLLRILHATGDTQRFLVDLIMNEVKNTENENLTFRGNTLATKSIDMYMKMVGKMYLQETLGSFIRFVYELEDDVEVDPQKLTSNAVLEENQKLLIKMVEDVWRCIQNSIDNFPSELQMVFYLVRQNCEAVHKDVASRLISASVFLRFLCPAILSPSLFQLTQEYPNEKAARTLTLIAKTIQNLANFTRFGGKESYMEILNNFVEQHMSRMEKFLKDVSCHPKVAEKSSFSGIIDLGRELSVLYHLLVEELPNVPKESIDELKPLSSIVDSLRDVYEMSPSAAEQRLSKRLESATGVCSKPLVKPGRPESPNPAPVAVRAESPGDRPYTPDRVDGARAVSRTPTGGAGPEYEDATLSFVGDYVSGCSLVCHTPCLSSRKKVQGRGKVSLTKSIHPLVHRASSFDLLSSSSTLERERMCRSVSESVLSHEGKGSRESLHRVDSGDRSRSYGTGAQVLPASDSDASSAGSQSVSVERRAGKGSGYSRHGDQLLKRKGSSNERLLWSKRDVRVVDAKRNGIFQNFASGVDHDVDAPEADDVDTALSQSWAHFSRVRELTSGKANLRNSPKPGRRFSELSPYRTRESMDPGSLGMKSVLQSQGADLAQIQPDGFVELLQQGLVHSRSGSFHSSCSSCSFSSRSYSSVEELNPYGIFIEGDSIVDMLTKNNMVDFQSSGAGVSGQRPVSKPGAGMRHKRAPTDEEHLQRDREVSGLRHQLADAQALLHRYQQQMTDRSAHFERTVLQLQDRLAEADKKMKFQKSETEQQMKGVINRLVSMESELRRDHAEMEGIIRAKQDVIDMQERRIQALNASNERLMKALLHSKRSSKETFGSSGDDVDLPLDGWDARRSGSEPSSLADLRSGDYGARRVHDV